MITESSRLMHIDYCKKVLNYLYDKKSKANPEDKFMITFIDNEIFLYEGLLQWLEFLKESRLRRDFSTNILNENLIKDTTDLSAIDRYYYYLDDIILNFVSTDTDNNKYYLFGNIDISFYYNEHKDSMLYNVVFKTLSDYRENFYFISMVNHDRFFLRTMWYGNIVLGSFLILRKIKKYLFSKYKVSKFAPKIRIWKKNQQTNQSD
jgi:hypothetical protein